MILHTVTARLNRLLGPLLLRHGLTLRHALQRGVVRDSPGLDAATLLPLSQKIVALESNEEARRVIEQRLKGKSRLDEWVDGVWDRYFEAGVGVDTSPTATGRDVDERGTNPHLAALSKHVRSALLPNEKWGDVDRWRFHHRFVRWVRTEYLRAAHGDELRSVLKEFPALRVGLESRRRGKKAVSTSALFGGFSGGSSHDDERRRGLPPLPTLSAVSNAFGFHTNSTNRSDSSARGDPMAELTTRLGGELYAPNGHLSSLRIALIDPETDVSCLTLGEVLELAGAHVLHGAGLFNLYCEEGDVYELWTKDYVRGLAGYLLDRADQLQRQIDDKGAEMAINDEDAEEVEAEVVVLDVGAGDGALAASLRQYLATEARDREDARKNRRKGVGQRGARGRKGSRPPLHRTVAKEPQKEDDRDDPAVPMVVATDDGSWGIRPRDSDVEGLSAQEALEKYGEGGRRNLIVLCSWMPMGEDWTAAFRNNRAVKEYVLIGECDDGNCGDNWETWGNPAFYVGVENAKEKNGATVDSGDKKESIENIATTMTPPYRLDGWTRHDLDRLSKLQFSRYESGTSRGGRTVSFRQQVGGKARNEALGVQ